MIRKFSFSALLVLITLSLSAQDNYSYSIDLTAVNNDELRVVLDPPAISQKSIMFHLPKIIPGTYSISDYGRFADSFQAMDKKGRNLPVEKINDNTWLIKKADKLEKITYSVEDTYDSDIQHQIYPMSGSNIEAGENYVIAPSGFFGYFEGMKNLPFQLTFTKPENLYGSTGLIPVTQTDRSVSYRTEDYDELIDSPIMFNVPDTTFINVGNAEVLISVYSPNNMVTSEFLASQLEKLLEAERKYLGGSLPVDKYAFIYYFDGSANPSPIQGALEHSYSSFYYLSETPQEQIIDQLVDIASHEFFHIVTPLTIHSEEIHDFDYNEADLSKHLWLYEGVTEYAADHVQVQYDLISIPEYVSKLEEKILVSKIYYNDTLPFTVLSERAADIHEDQYGNVYEKGALIAAMLDIRLNELSEGKYDLQQLLQDLQQKYGKNKAFKDEELFDVITSLTYPEIMDFFQQYVAGSQSLPLEEYFQKVGISYIPEQTQKQFTLGNIQIGYDPESGNLIVANTDQMNEFGKALGWKKDDKILTIQGEEFTPMTGQRLLTDLQQNVKEGDTLNIVVQRGDQEVNLQQEVFFVEVPLEHQLRLMENPSYEQLKLRNQWLKANAVTARPKDVESVDAILNTLYAVISGPAGERDWDRFKSLFTPEANLSALASMPSGVVYITMTPDDYEDRNKPVFMQTGFYEEEIGRTVNKFANMAQVFSAYQYKLNENGAVQQRGINSIQLAFFEGRWWITSLLWNGEESEQIPEQYLNKN